jgi:hypothetical protein
MTAIGPGSKVRCVKDDWEPVDYATPKIGFVCTVLSAVRTGEVMLPGWCLAGRDYLTLVEYGYDKFFATECFIPLGGDAEIEKLRKIAENPVSAPPLRVPGGVYV